MSIRRPVSPNEPLKASLLDRLTPDYAGTAGSPFTVRELRDAVRRDLENLLNTRRCCTAPESWPRERSELKNSLLHYGLPDLARFAGSPKAGNQLREEIKRTVKQFEPRLRRVEVHRADAEAPSGGRGRSEGRQELRYRIEADLLAYPQPQAVSYDTAVEPATTRFEVKGAGR